MICCEFGLFNLFILRGLSAWGPEEEQAPRSSAQCHNSARNVEESRLRYARHRKVSVRLITSEG